LIFSIAIGEGANLFVLWAPRTFARAIGAARAAAFELQKA